MIIDQLINKRIALLDLIISFFQCTKYCFYRINKEIPIKKLLKIREFD